MSSMRKISIVLLLLSCMSVQGCLKSYFAQKQYERKVERIKGYPRFHINGIEFYRDHPLVDLTPPFYLESDGHNIEIFAKIRSVNDDGTAGTNTGYIHFRVTSDSALPDSENIEADYVSVSYAPYYSPGYRLTIDSCNLSFLTFTGCNPGDSIRVKFSFEGKAYKAYYPEGSSKYEWEYVESISCTDGVLKEVVIPRPW